MPCVVPTCGSTDGTFRLFPRHPMLAERWLEAVQLGSGVLMEVAEDAMEDLCQTEICDWHFGDEQDGSQEGYQEPRLFVDGKGQWVEVLSCRLCLHYFPAGYMVSKDGTLGEHDIAGSVYELLSVCLQEDDFLKLICLECLTRLEMISCIQRDFAQTEAEYQELVRIRRKSEQEVYCTIKIEHPPVDAFIEEERVESTPEPEEDVVCTVESAVLNQEEQQLPIESISSGRRKVLKPLGKRGPKRKAERIKPRRDLKEATGKKCYICQSVFSDGSELTTHLTEQHANKIDYRCVDCSMDFPLVGAYNRHLARHDETDRPYKCNECPIRYSSLNQLKIHENRLHGAKHDVQQQSERARPNICEICGKLFKFKSKLNVHVRVVHNKIDLPQCKICNKSFTATSSLERHMLLHSNEKPHTCDRCGSTFRRLLNLRHHVNKVHEGKNPHVCSECNEQFNNYHALYMHKQYVHLKKVPPSDKPKPYQVTCALCQLSYKKSIELTNHIKSTHPDQPYPYPKCPECPQTFLTKNHLAQHKSIHTDKYVCTFCGRRHTTVQRLQVHMESKHSDVQQYDCPVCITKSYKTASALQRHLAIHTKGKQFVCEFCDKTFLRKDQMLIHRRIHTGEKPFQCVVCSKRFSDDGTFCKHKKRCQIPLPREVEDDLAELLNVDF